VKQGEVYLSTPSPSTGDRELRVIVSSDAYNTRPGCVSVLVAEIETGTRLRPTQHGILTDYGVVLADRIIWFPLEMVGERFGQISNEERNAVVDATCLVIRGR
ncbi:MAG: type II toxin-antitoxin system PemK/MazF family toxin, partial [Pseudonocardiaceae bacterium]